jgi:hypothetical protein
MTGRYGAMLARCVALGLWGLAEMLHFDHQRQDVADVAVDREGLV